VHDDLVEAASRNGEIQNQLDKVETRLTSRQNTIQGLISDVSDVDMAKAATNLTQAQQVLQAYSQVFVSLRSTSLLNYLR
jgi:flagellar hook-associated protein 3 FlgL